MKYEISRPIVWGACSFILVLVLIIFLLLRGNPSSQQHEESASDVTVSDAIRFKEDYESFNNTLREDDGIRLMEVEIPEDNSFVYATVDDVWEFSKEGTGIVFIGGSWCRICRLIVPEICSVSAENELKYPILYIPLQRNDNSGKSQNGKELAKEICDYIRKAGTSFANVEGTEARIGYCINAIEENGDSLFASTIIFYNKGNIVGMNLGTVQGHENSDEQLTDEEKIRFKEIFNKFYSDLGKSPCPYDC